MTPFDVILWALAMLVCLAVAVVFWAIGELAYEALRSAIAKRKAAGDA